MAFTIPRLPRSPAALLYNPPSATSAEPPQEAALQTRRTKNPTQPRYTVVYHRNGLLFSSIATAKRNRKLGPFFRSPLY